MYLYQSLNVLLLSMKLDFGIRNSCPACKEKSYSVIQVAVLSPWVLQIANLRKMLLRTLLLKCESCGTAYFDIFYGETVLKSIYERYRGETYFRVRHSWERSYSEKLNSGLNNDAKWMAWRRSSVERVLVSAGMNLHGPIKCVDIGGGEGGVMPIFPKGQKFVLDSNTKIDLPKDVSRLTDYSQLSKVNPDLIMCCGLLEHLNSPNDFLVDLLDSSKETLFYYFEVPAGIPKARNRFVEFLLFQKIITTNRWFWRLFSWLDSKVANKNLIGFMPIKVSEHLNFFSYDGLLALMQHKGLSVVSIDKFSTNNNLPDSQGLAFTDAWQILVKREI
jgi:hypothetical protein